MNCWSASKNSSSTTACAWRAAWRCPTAASASSSRFCYTDPQDRQFIQQAAELAARHFDEVIQDDFFFVNTKTDSDIAAKGNEQLDAVPARVDG